MIDLALNDDFSVYLDDRNDLATVEGQEAFEQSVAVMLTDFMHNSVTGFAGTESTIQEKLRLEATRVAQRHDALESIANIQIDRDEDRPDTYLVTIDYVASDSYQFEINQ